MRIPVQRQPLELLSGSKHIVKDGIRHNKRGVIQKFNCLDCSRCFTVNLGFEGMKHEPRIITMVMQLYFSGESLRNTQRDIMLMGVKVSHVAILKWIRKYIGLMDTYLERLTPQVSDTWRADTPIQGRPNLSRLHATARRVKRRRSSRQSGNQGREITNG